MNWLQRGWIRGVLVLLLATVVVAVAAVTTVNEPLADVSTEMMETSLNAHLNDDLMDSLGSDFSPEEVIVGDPGDIQCVRANKLSPSVPKGLAFICANTSADVLFTALAIFDDGNRCWQAFPYFSSDELVSVDMSSGTFVWAGSSNPFKTMPSRGHFEHEARGDSGMSPSPPKAGRCIAGDQVADGLGSTDRRRMA